MIPPVEILSELQNLAYVIDVFEFNNGRSSYLVLRICETL